jgi:hypothetical protein
MALHHMEGSTALDLLTLVGADCDFVFQGHGDVELAVTEFQSLAINFRFACEA